MGRLDSLSYAAFQTFCKGHKSLSRTHPSSSRGTGSKGSNSFQASCCETPSSAFSLHSLFYNSPVFPQHPQIFPNHPFWSTLAPPLMITLFLSPKGSCPPCPHHTLLRVVWIVQFNVSKVMHLPEDLNSRWRVQWRWGTCTLLPNYTRSPQSTPCPVTPGSDPPRKRCGNLHCPMAASSRVMTAQGPTGQRGKETFLRVVSHPVSISYVSSNYSCSHVHYISQWKFCEYKNKVALHNLSRESYTRSDSDGTLSW